MKTSLYLALTLPLLLCCFNLHAETVEQSGNAFLRLCAATEEQHPNIEEIVKASNCYGYVNGIDDGLQYGAIWQTYKDGKPLAQPVCEPDSVDNDQRVRIVMKYIRDHPEIAERRSAFLVMQALRHAFPCPATSGR